MMRILAVALLSVLAGSGCSDLFGSGNDGPPCDRFCTKINACLPNICDGDKECETRSRCGEASKKQCQQQLDQGNFDQIECVLGSSCTGLQGCAGGF